MALTPHPRRGKAVLARGLGMALGVVADRLIPDPQRHHPVAVFGNAAARLEQRTWADSTSRGALHVAACLTPLVALGVAAERATARHPLVRTVLTAATTWAVLGASSLAREGRTMADRLAANDLPAAREQLSHLCSRDADRLDAPELARATVESMAENTSDAAVASLVWGAAAGIPGMLLHRGSNTLDAMIGHHNERYEHFGTVAARLDDLLDLPASRLTGLLACALAGTVGGDRHRAMEIMMRDHAHHPSPNGGWCESAWAGTLGVQLGGRNLYYGNRVEDRPLLGDGPRPDAGKVADSARLVTRVTDAAAGIIVLALASLAHVVHHGGLLPRQSGLSRRSGRADA